MWHCGEQNCRKSQPFKDDSRRSAPDLDRRGESYVILRTGVKAQQGSSYEQEIVVFPQSAPGGSCTGSRQENRVSMASSVC